MILQYFDRLPIKLFFNCGILFKFTAQCKRTRQCEKRNKNDQDTEDGKGTDASG